MLPQFPVHPHAMCPPLAALLLAGCNVPSPGEQGNLAFVWAGEIFSTLSTPLAAGAQARLEVLDLSEVPVDAVSAAESTDTSVLSLGPRFGHVLTLAGEAPGTATLEVTADGLSDRIPITVAEAALGSFTGPTDLAEGERWLSGGTARLRLTLRTADDEPLVGAGRADAVSVSEAELARVDGYVADDPTHLHIGLLAPGSVEVAWGDGEPFALDIAPSDALASLAFEGAGSGPLAMRVGDVQSVRLVGTDGEGDGLRGLLDAVALRLEPGGVCEAAPDWVFGDGWWRVTGVAEGTCTLSATAGEQTAEVSFEVLSP
jgi:hypothetical protein